MVVLTALDSLWQMFVGFFILNAVIVLGLTYLVELVYWIVGKILKKRDQNRSSFHM